MSTAVPTKTVIIIAGPTAVGKTAAAIEVAKHFGTEIISADSRQCFREMRIGVARPSDAELEAVRHHFIASHSIHDDVTAATFEKFALEKTHELFLHHDHVVLTGGTGLYIRAFCEGLDQIPPIPEQTRSAIQQQYETHGIDWLTQQLQSKDPLFAQRGEMQNPQRMMRALEVVTTTGQSILLYHTAHKAVRPFSIIRIALDLPREELYTRINDRVDLMMEAGQLDEAKQLYPFRHVNALQTVGYEELFSYLDNKLTLGRAVDLIKQHTRNYAKRQLTWFRRDKEISWFHPAHIKEILVFLEGKC